MKCKNCSFSETEVSKRSWAHWTACIVTSSPTTPTHCTGLSNKRTGTIGNSSKLLCKSRESCVKYIPSVSHLKPPAYCKYKILFTSPPYHETPWRHSSNTIWQRKQYQWFLKIALFERHSGRKRERERKHPSAGSLPKCLQWPRLGQGLIQ